MISNICKSIICLGGLLLCTSCTSHRTVYISDAYLEPIPESVVVVNPVPSVIVFEDRIGPYFYARRYRCDSPFYSMRRRVVSRYYAPGYYVPMRAYRSHSEVYFGVGFSRRFR